MHGAERARPHRRPRLQRRTNRHAQAQGENGWTFTQRAARRGREHGTSFKARLPSDGPLEHTITRRAAATRGPNVTAVLTWLT